MLTRLASNEFDLSRNHLSKVLQRLARAGIVETRRGRGGGTVLARPAEALRPGPVIAFQVLRKDEPL